MSTSNMELEVFSNSSFFDQQQPQLSMNFAENIQTFPHPGVQRNDALIVPPLELTPDFSSHENRNANALHTVESLVNFSPPLSGCANNKSLSVRKRKRNNERAVEKPKEGIHVRAKRGQATDSHSLAERVRREKINERLSCLQDLVPGCYKTMGMAAMLDVIINYVQSLQNQIEFLSKNLSAASMYYDFNSELDDTETMPGANEYETRDMERMVKEGYGGPSWFHST